MGAGAGLSLIPPLGPLSPPHGSASSPPPVYRKKVERSSTCFRQAEPATWLHCPALACGALSWLWPGVAAGPLPRVGSGRGTCPCGQVLTPPPSPHGLSIREVLGRTQPAPSLQVSGHGAPRSSHLSVLPAGWASGAPGGQGETFFYKNQASRNHLHRCPEEGPYLSWRTLWAWPGSPGARWRAAGRTPARRRLPWEPQPGSTSRGASWTKARPRERC